MQSKQCDQESLGLKEMFFSSPILKSMDVFVFTGVQPLGLYTSRSVVITLEEGLTLRALYTVTTGQPLENKSSLSKLSMAWIMEKMQEIPAQLTTIDQHLQRNKSSQIQLNEKNETKGQKNRKRREKTMKKQWKNRSLYFDFNFNFNCWCYLSYLSFFF